MATIRERSGKLIADFRYMGIRCRETTNLEDNAYNRRILKKRLEQLEAEITLGTFEYEKYFPKSSIRYGHYYCWRKRWGNVQTDDE